MANKLDISDAKPFDDGVPVDREDRSPGELRGAGARSPLFWKLMLVAMALMWGFSFCMMKDVLDALPPYLLLACRFQPDVYRRRPFDGHLALGCVRVANRGACRYHGGKERVLDGNILRTCALYRPYGDGREAYAL